MTRRTYSDAEDIEFVARRRQILANRAATDIRGEVPIGQRMVSYLTEWRRNQKNTEPKETTE